MEPSGRVDSALIEALGPTLALAGQAATGEPRRVRLCSLPFSSSRKPSHLLPGPTGFSTTNHHPTLESDPVHPRTPNPHTSC